MAFSKDIQLCKEHRKQYRGAAAWDKSCRPHGGCDWCKDDRTFQDQKARSGADARLKDIETEIDIYKDSI
jgi:hypothetical protein